MLEKAPSVIEIGGALYPLKTSFRRALRTFSAFKDRELSNENKQAIMIHNLFGEINEFLPEMLEYAVWFLKCGKEERQKNERPVVDFDADAQRIYDAFLKKGVDIDTVKLHWWTFMGHMAELPECSLTRIMHLRYQNNNGRLTKQEREECSRIGWDVINIQNSFDVVDEPDWLV